MKSDLTQQIGYGVRGRRILNAPRKFLLKVLNPK